MIIKITKSIHIKTNIKDKIPLMINIQIRITKFK